MESMSRRYPNSKMLADRLFQAQIKPRGLADLQPRCAAQNQKKR
jgi:hypothetical protein